MFFTSKIQSVRFFSDAPVCTSALYTGLEIFYTRYIKFHK